MISEIERLSSDFHSKLDSVNALIKFFPLMYDNFENTVSIELGNGLGIEGQKYDVLDLVGMIASKRVENIHKKRPEFYGLHQSMKKYLPLSSYRLHFSRSPEFLREMSLVFIVSTFYSYLLDLIKSLLLENFELLIKSEILSISHQELELQAHQFAILAIDGGMKNVGKNLKEFFNLDLTKKKNWMDFLELFERRNVFVHNDGKPTTKYMNSFNKYTKNSKLDVDSDYLVESINLLKGYQSEIENHIFQNFVNVN